MDVGSGPILLAEFRQRVPLPLGEQSLRKPIERCRVIDAALIRDERIGNFRQQQIRFQFFDAIRDARDFILACVQDQQFASRGIDFLAASKIRAS